MSLETDFAHVTKKFGGAPTTERDIQWAIRYVLGRRDDCLIFRNQTGATEELGLTKLWVEAVYKELCTGSVSKARAMVRKVTLLDGRWIRYGLGEGSSDLVGLIKPSGRFFAIEVKTATGRPTAKQVAWMKLVESYGGVAELCRSVQDALVVYRKAGGCE